VSIKEQSRQGGLCKRKSTVEPVFGIIKSVLGYRQFLRRGRENADAEWTLVSLTWNLKRMHILARPRPKIPVVAVCKAKSGVNRGQLSVFWSIELFEMVWSAKILTMRIIETILATN